MTTEHTRLTAARLTAEGVAEIDARVADLEERREAGAWLYSSDVRYLADVPRLLADRRALEEEHATLWVTMEAANAMLRQRDQEIASLRTAIVTAHGELHRWERQAGPGHPLHGAVTRAHEALHQAGARNGHDGTT